MAASAVFKILFNFFQLKTSVVKQTFNSKAIRIKPEAGNYSPAVPGKHGNMSKILAFINV